MDILQQELLNRKKRLEQAIRLAEETLRNAPEGSLRIDHRQNSVHYYHVVKPNTNGLYIPKKDAEMVGLLANKSYCLKFVKKAKAELKTIQKFLSQIQSYRAESVFSDLVPEKKLLVTPLLLGDDDYAERWTMQQYESNTSYREQCTFCTDRGEWVRSKTELIQANIYHELGIPYRYECAMTMQNGSVWYPDFTSLDVRHRKVYYHEHFGLMDDPEYRKKAFRKINEYAKNGICLGKNLLITFETTYCPFDPSLFRRTLKEVFGVT